MTTIYTELARNLAVNPRGKNPTGTAVVIRRNLVPNPRALTTSGWGGSASTGGTASSSLLTGIVDHPLGLSTGFRRTWTVAPTATAGGAWVGPTNDTTWGIPVVAGASYTASVWARLNRTRDMRVTLAWYDSAGFVAATSLSTANGPTVTVGANTWVQLQHTAVAPAGALWVQLRCYSAAATTWAAGDIIDVTGAVVESSTTWRGFFDGDSPDDPAHTYGWTAAAAASPSTLTVRPPASWTATGTSVAPTLLAEGDPDGSRYVRVLHAATATETTGVSVAADATSYPVGTQVTVSTMIRPTRSLTVTPRVNGQVAGPAVTCPPGVWTEVRGLAILPTAGALTAQPQWTGQPADVIDVGNVLLHTGPDRGVQFFDGDTPAPDAATVSFLWTGTPYASPSIWRQATVTVDPAGTGTFVPLADTVWGLGDYDNPDVQFNGRDAAGVEWVLAKVDGWKTVTADTPVVRADGADGGWFTPGTLAPRVITLHGAFRACTTVDLDAAETRLRAAIERTADDQTLWAGGPVPKQLTVRLTGALEVDDASRFVRTFSAVMTAADPYKYAAGAAGQLTAVTKLPVLTGLPGITFPMTFPSNFGGAESANGRLLINNPGTKPVYPTVTLTGPGPNLRLTHMDLGVASGFGQQLMPGQKVVLDHAARTVVADGRSQYAYRLPGTVFFPLLPGLNSLAFRADAYDAAAQATVSYRPRWT